MNPSKINIRVYTRVVLTRCDQNIGRVLLEYDQHIVTQGTVAVFSLDSTRTS